MECFPEVERGGREEGGWEWPRESASLHVKPDPRLTFVPSSFTCARGSPCGRWWCYWEINRSNPLRTL